MNKYSSNYLAKSRDELRKEGHYHEAGMIHGIAQEELTHARILKEIVDKTSR